MDGDSTKGDIASKARKIEDNQILGEIISVFSIVNLFSFTHSVHMRTILTALYVTPFLVENVSLCLRIFSDLAVNRNGIALGIRFHVWLLWLCKAMA